MIIDVNDAAGNIAHPDWLARAETVHRQLRPQLPESYAAKMASVFAGGGRMCVATRGRDVTGVAVYRVYDNTFCGLHMYVDDLVTAEDQRSTGVGRALLTHLEALARRAGCAVLALDSGTQRQQAHKFYFREGLVVTSFHFSKALSPSAR